MKLTDQQKKKLRSLSQSSYSKILFEFLEAVKTEVADVRNPIPCKSELDKEVRISTCDAIDQFIIEKIKRAGVDRNTGFEEEYI